MFKDYQSKPVTRSAHRVVESDVITKIDEATSLLQSKDFTEELHFKHYAPVLVGDYVVYLDGEDVYHCSAAVFAERNVV